MPCNGQRSPRLQRDIAMRYKATVVIGGDVVLPLVIGVFIVTFVVVCAIAYVVLSSKRTGQQNDVSTLHLRFSSRLPISKGVFDLIGRTAAAAVSRPHVEPSTRIFLDRLAAKRFWFVRFYKAAMISIGLVGLTAAIALFRAHTPANMLGLPAAIILLLSLGAILSGLVPPSSVQPVVAPIDPRLLEKIKVHVSPDAPLTVSLSDSDVKRAADLLRQGLPVAVAARAIYADYDKLNEFEQRAFESALRRSVKRATDDHRGTA